MIAQGDPADPDVGQGRERRRLAAGRGLEGRDRVDKRGDLVCRDASIERDPLDANGLEASHQPAEVFALRHRLVIDDDLIADDAHDQ